MAVGSCTTVCALADSESVIYVRTIVCFFFNDTTPTEIYTLSLHDALPILEVVIWRESSVSGGSGAVQMFLRWQQRKHLEDRKSGSAGMPRPISYAVFCLKKKNI